MDYTQVSLSDIPFFFSWLAFVNLNVLGTYECLGHSNV